MEILFFNELKLIFQSYLRKVFKTHQVFRDVDWPIFSKTFSSDSILQIEVKLKSERRPIFWKTILTKLYRVKIVAYSHFPSAFRIILLASYP